VSLTSQDAPESVVQRWTPTASCSARDGHGHDAIHLHRAGRGWVGTPCLCPYVHKWVPYVHKTVLYVHRRTHKNCGPPGERGQLTVSGKVRTDPARTLRPGGDAPEQQPFRTIVEGPTYGAPRSRGGDCDRLHKRTSRRQPSHSDARRAGRGAIANRSCVGARRARFGMGSFGLLRLLVRRVGLAVVSL
jgi:hypothetical protein